MENRGENATVPHIQVTVDENDINNGAREILKFIRPQWNEQELYFKLLTDGITNKLVGCRPISANDSEIVLIRVYGNKSELLIDRKAETNNIILLNSVGLAPNLYATFLNGLAYQFVPGTTLTDKTVTEPRIYDLVAKKMARLHKVEVPGKKKEPCLWRKMEKFYDLVPETFSDVDKQKRYNKLIVPKTQLAAEIKLLKNVLINLDSPIVFAHNDLLLGNVIYTECQNTVTFIDYEYADYNYQAFDIGNHFAEFVGVEQVDYGKYPKKDLQKEWIQRYLTEFHGRSPNNIEVEKVYVQVNQFALASHLFWGLWALIQTEHSYIDFDFLGYASIRLNEYFAKKDEFLALQLPL